jgi:hypothetical protein
MHVCGNPQCTYEVDPRKIEKCPKCGNDPALEVWLTPSGGLCCKCHALWVEPTLSEPIAGDRFAAMMRMIEPWMPIMDELNTMVWELENEKEILDKLIDANTPFVDRMSDTRLLVGIVGTAASAGATVAYTQDFLVGVVVGILVSADAVWDPVMRERRLDGWADLLDRAFDLQAKVIAYHKTMNGLLKEIGDGRASRDAMFAIEGSWPDRLAAARDVAAQAQEIIRERESKRSLVVSAVREWFQRRK